MSFSDPARLAGYQRMHQIPFPILSDPARLVYHRYGLVRGSVGRVWGLRAAKRYLQILRTSGLSQLRRPNEDTLQLGGDFVIGPDGKLVYAFWGQGPDDRPSVDDLIAAVQTVMP